MIALELERIAIHIGDMAALCNDTAYQFGQVVNEALRTLVINTTQLWCGNRFGKGLIRPYGSNYPLSRPVIEKIQETLKEVEERFLQISDRVFTLPSVLGRFEGTGRLSLSQATRIGTVGMAARSSGLKRDIRWSHPFHHQLILQYEPVILPGGDVLSRALIRKLEIEKSISLLKELLIHKELSGSIPKPEYTLHLQPESFALSLTEGWRGEICHTALTDDSGNIVYYKIKDPSFHNWMALALVVRGQEISDFPLCNKSFNLSYCGNDFKINKFR